MKVLAVVLLACLASPALAAYCTSYYGATSSSRTCSVYVAYGQRIAAATNSLAVDVSGQTGSGDTTLAVRLPGYTTGTAWLYNDDSCGTTQSYIPFRCVPYTGSYTIEGSCFSCGSTCSASIYYQIDTPAGACSSGTGSCTTGTPGTTYVNSGSISNCGTSSSNGASSSSNGYSSGGSGGYYGSTIDVTNKGWAAPAALAAAIGLAQIVLWIVYGTRVASDMACCGCAPTAADRALPSIVDSPAGSMHMHTLALVILLPLSAVLVFVAMCVDGYEVVRDQRDAMYGAFGAHQKSTRYSYDDLCPKQQGNVYTSNNRMCPSLRTAGAMTFIGELLGLLAVVAAVIKFASSSPYAASGKTAFSGGKPVIPRASCRLIEFYSMSISMATIMWIAAGHGALSWFFSYNLSDAGYVQLGPSWALLLVGSVIAIFPALIARREALRDQPQAGAAQQGVVPGAKTNTPVAAAQPAMQQPAMQQPYAGGAVYGGGMPMQQQQMPQYSPQPMYAAQPQQPGLTGYAPQYAQNAPPPQYGGAPPAYAVAAPAPAQPVVVVQQQPMAAVVRVPVQPPAGLALPPGAILYSNGDVCDAAGNVLGVVPGMRGPQQVVAVPVAGTA